jgi:menaquinone-dependent protoporphyrinogen oxidase
MTVLVTVASRNGAAFELGEQLALDLAAHGQTAVCARPQDVGGLRGYDAVVLGSAVDAGEWLEPAAALAGRLGPQLRDRPVWLFSAAPAGVEHVCASTGAIGHRVLAMTDERLRRNAIRAFAGEIADHLRTGDGR